MPAILFTRETKMRVLLTRMFCEAPDRFNHTLATVHRAGQWARPVGYDHVLGRKEVLETEIAHNPLGHDLSTQYSTHFDTSDFFLLSTLVREASIA